MAGRAGQEHRRDLRPRRVAMISLHTSPLDQPGLGDAGGMNVYVLELARRLAATGARVDIFTRASRPGLPDVVDVLAGVRVCHVEDGASGALRKSDLPSVLCGFAAGMLQTAGAHRHGYDVVHAHYWLSGQVGMLAAERWDVPLVHSMHTLARVKNEQRVAGDPLEPRSRIVGEHQVIARADRLVANTEQEARDLVSRYRADPGLVTVVHPGVDLARFVPGDPDTARARLGLPADADVLLFAGRVQPLKSPDVLLRAVAALLDRQPWRRSRLVVAVVGGSSGRGPDQVVRLRDVTRELGLEDVVRFAPPVPPADLATWYRAATLVAVPSRSESFGLVALEAQACGTPVVAASVGGLRTAVADGASGVLLGSYRPGEWADALLSLLDRPDERARLARGALLHARRFSWDATAEQTLACYSDARAAREARHFSGLTQAQ